MILFPYIYEMLGIVERKSGKPPVKLFPDRSLKLENSY